MELPQVELGSVTVSRLILGGNPFSGFSHQTSEQDTRMRRWYTAARIKATLAEAEAIGVSAFLGRTDRHILRVLEEYWAEGGTIRWIAQTAPELASVEMAIDRAVHAGAVACFLHGGQMDHFLAQGRLNDVPGWIARIRSAGLAAGVAGHLPQVHEWARENLDLDFHMCSYYNPSDRSAGPSTQAGTREKFDSSDRDAMMATIAQIDRPVIHYKVLAAGRLDSVEALTFVAKQMRPTDAVCVGVYTEDRANMLAEDLQILQAAWRNGDEPHPRRGEPV